MRAAALRNASVRWLLCRGMLALGWWVQRRTRRSLSTWAAGQAALRAELAIRDDTPLADYDDATRVRAEAVPGAHLVKTSGSTDRPKVIAYTPARLRAVQRSFAGATLRSLNGVGARRPIIFTLAGLAADDSLTALMTRRTPSRLELALMPHAVLALPAARPLVERYGVDAVRVWAIALSRPGWLYSTNPSTQAVFFHHVASAWDESLALLRDFRRDPTSLGRDVLHMAKLIVTPRWRERADRMLDSPTPLPPGEWLDLEAHCSWDGGNTGAFLRQVSAHLPGVRFIPMFSMSTETLETLPVFEGGRAYFLPIAPGVLYELLPEDAPEAPESLIPPGEAREGSLYELVVSDAYGLRRYRTADLFRCAGHLQGLPDLRFVRRRGLSWSFTGEKLTGRQLELAYARLLTETPGLSAVHLCLVPSQDGEARLPSYVLALVTGGARLPAVLPPLDELARRFDTILGELNEEYASKRSSQRLAAPEARAVDYDALARAMRGGEGASERGWDSQLKVLPLVRTTWQELGL